MYCPAVPEKSEIAVSAGWVSSKGCEESAPSLSPCVSMPEFPPPPTRGHARRAALNRDAGPHRTLGLPAPGSWTSASGTVRNELLLFMSRRVYGFLVDVARWACPRVGVSGESMPRGWGGHGLSLGRVAEDGGSLGLRAHG